MQHRLRRLSWPLNRSTSSAPRATATTISTASSRRRRWSPRIRRVPADPAAQSSWIGSRVHKKDLKDAAHTFQMLKLEMIRHHFWHKEIDEKALKHARRKGKAGIRAAIEHRLREVASRKNPWDGRQTPKEGNIIYYAQHATATCCRKCLEEWHAIPLDKELSDEEIAYLTDLCVMFINERLPELTEDGEKIPPTRKPKAARPSQRRRLPNDGSHRHGEGSPTNTGRRRWT